MSVQDISDIVEVIDLYWDEDTDSLVCISEPEDPL